MGRKNVGHDRPNALKVLASKGQAHWIFILKDRLTRWNGSKPLWRVETNSKVPRVAYAAVSAGGGGMPRRGRQRTKTITTGGSACLSRIYNHPFGLLKMHWKFWQASGRIIGFLFLKGRLMRWNGSKPLWFFIVTSMVKFSLMENFLCVCFPI